MFGPEERQRAVDLYSATPMATAQVVEHLGYPTRQCLERWLAADPRYAGHMAKPIIPLETRTKAIEPVPDGMRGSGPPNGSAHPSGGSRNVNGCPSLIRLCTIRRVLVRRMCWSAMMSSSQRLFWSRNPAKFRSHWLYDAIHSAAVLTSETRDDVVA